MGVGIGALAAKSSIGVGGIDRNGPESVASMSKAIWNGVGDSGRVPAGKLVREERMLCTFEFCAEPGTGRGEE